MSATTLEHVNRGPAQRLEISASAPSDSFFCTLLGPKHTTFTSFHWSNDAYPHNEVFEASLLAIYRYCGATICRSVILLASCTSKTDRGTVFSIETPTFVLSPDALSGVLYGHYHP